MKQKIYNLIILDESGSMNCIRMQTIDGCNETINTIKSAEKKFSETQEHYVSIYAFQTNDECPSRYLIKNQPASEVRAITRGDYKPYGCTPLNDAIGSTLLQLKDIVGQDENAIGSVTIITDGMENSSTEFTSAQVSRMISDLKEKGWNFNFIGANIDVKATAAQYHINNSYAFDQSEKGTASMFNFEKGCRFDFYARVSDIADLSGEERIEALKKADEEYFEAKTE